MARVILRVLFVLSLSLNIAFTIHLFTARPAESKEQKPALNLSANQEKQLSGIRLKIHKENEEIRKKIAECHKKVMAALKSETVDREQINHCIERISAMQKRIQQNTVEEILEMKKMLTPHQCNCLMEGLDAELHHKACTKECCSPTEKQKNEQK